MATDTKLNLNEQQPTDDQNFEKFTCQPPEIILMLQIFDQDSKKYLLRYIH